MGDAFQCDKCGRFFVSLPKHRVVARKSFTGDTSDLAAFRQGHMQLDLCSSCAKEFDIKMSEVYGVYLDAYSKRNPGKDEGHEGSEDIETE
jgi:transcription elongation factor Elf1